MISITPTVPFDPQEVAFGFAGTTTPPVPVLVGINTLLLSGNVNPTPDIVAVAATLTGDGITNIPGPTGTGVLAVAVSNVGISGTIEATADTGAAVLPVSISLCETNPGTGACKAPPAASGAVRTQ